LTPIFGSAARVPGAAGNGPARSQTWLYAYLMVGSGPTTPVTGRCLCGAVRYEVRGPLRDVLICHCEECRRWHGHVCAAASARRADLVFLEQGGLRWITSPNSDAGARRGFCGECGSSLFWDLAGRETISIAAGTLDPPTGLRIIGHWYTSQASDYYDIPDDGLPHHQRGG
jgi:hypothetical protein